jgi:diaminohydroxyphosphoribosylaminopyrimidine deaminase/5-amino-6-(5-phosphoribosylamino)uracil reductase
MVEDLRWMRRALTHARRGLGRTTPNPVVGACVVTADGVVVGDGAHERAGDAHAEIHAIDEAGDRARGATLYSTLEPCSHTGRTGPCTGRIIAAGVRRVVAAMEDPHPLVSGRGFRTLRDHGIEVDVGTGRAEAIRLNQPFLTAVRERRPFLILKAATSLDGYVAAAHGERTQLTSEAAARHAHFVRAQVDAVGIGSGTLLADDPLLTARHVYRERPLARVVFAPRRRRGSSRPSGWAR